MKVAAASGAVALLLPVLVIGAAVGGLAGTQLAPPGSGAASADIPADYLALYQQAAGRFTLPWTLLAAVGKVECDHGRGACSTPNAAGAEGPMQFLPATFAAYAWAAPSPAPSPYAAADAINAAAAKLAADGANTAPWAALFAYNHDDRYVATVIAWAVTYGWAPPDSSLLVLAALQHPSIDLRPEAAADVRSDRVDPRVLAVLLTVATRHRLDDVGPFITGHSIDVAGTTRPSNHAFGRAVDLPVVDGAPVDPSNSAAHQLAEDLMALPEGLRPDEVGSPWADLGGPGAFSDAAHKDHIHIGFDT